MLKNPEFTYLIRSFEKWLNTLEYAISTVNISVSYLRDFFEFLEEFKVKSINEIDKIVIEVYYEYLQTRKNKRQTGSLSQNYIISNINALKRFVKYLQVTGKQSFEVDLKISTNKEYQKTILTQEEIKALYNACDNSTLGIRDRAMLSVYYGCGLRREEAIHLNVNDINLKERLIYVQNGKGNRERYVPMSEAVREDLENYIYVAREKILSFKNIKNPALFLSYRVKRMHGNSLIERLHKLTNKAGINKETGFHTLRHSIATHLLQSGMLLENVSKFLGHTSLESTQIYTHLAHE
ncbi:tyrosine-type recombinase/integrase [Bacteroidota bacterium]